LINEIYRDIICTGDCLLDTGTAEPLDITNGVVDQTVDFVLDTGGEISGVVTSQSDASPIAQALVELYDATGNPVAQVTTDGQGAYAFEGLAYGDYRMLATPQIGAFSPVLYDAIDCSNGCTVANGSPVIIDNLTSFVAGINFALPSTVSGKDTDIHPTAQLGVGVEISRGSTVGAYTVIGAGTIVNKEVSIAERCRIGELVLIEQGAEIGKYCEIGDQSLIGRNADIGDYVHIGSNTIIGKNNIIGTDITDDENIASDRVYIGNDVELGPGVEVWAGGCIPDNYGKVRKNTIIRNANLCGQ